MGAERMFQGLKCVTFDAFQPLASRIPLSREGQLAITDYFTAGTKPYLAIKACPSGDSTRAIKALARSAFLLSEIGAIG